MSDSVDMTGITRMDQPSSSTHGWMVRLQRKGVRHGRFFSDSEWGGLSESLAVAIAFRDRLVARFERQSDPETTIRIHESITTRNSSGVVGVSRIRQISNDTEYFFWQASWTDPDGRRRSVRFSVLKHGEDRAFELACEARSEAVRK
ncbi:MAG: AP2/ERF family transcription factor [Verrucomicrobiota bacterium]